MSSFQGKITHLSQKGLGVVHHPENGLSYFVAGTWPGDIGEFAITDRPLNNKKYGYARLIRLTQPSPQRKTPECRFLGFSGNDCSGCPWMIADYNSQLDQKRNRFLYAMHRTGFDPDRLKVGPVQPSPGLLGYRNRFQVKTDGEKLGFVAEGSHHIVPIEDCLVLNDTCRQQLHTLRRHLPNPEWTPAPGHDWNFIDLDDQSPVEPVSLNCRQPFRQGNDAQNQWMKAWLKHTLGQHGNLRQIVELFCGSGNFTEVIAHTGCPEILAYEADPRAIAVLQQKHFPGVTARTADLYHPFIWKTLRKRVKDADTLILDPPRSGLKTLQGFFEAFTSLETICYISCDPATFAHDTRAFCRQGWQFSNIQLVDLFPHTPHVEVMAVLRREHKARKT
ncbi:RNA methyltransferase [Nitrosomonas sp.]|uniref:class I SAM-dependent RNA methyltransferase n=1 Tax=Nitrosomonas sp. TaxID=42353 RepID=UPI0025DD9F30|nr:RNA methyltransferase [Nitrosomonas sp.]MCC6916915.1 class I SAM-dependent RNA methyltransferase [Nitrosomonas sp.]